MILLFIVGAIICLILQKSENNTQDTNKLTICIVCHIIFLVIHGILLLYIFNYIFIPESLFFLYLAATVILVIWHICLIKGASRRKQIIFEKENTIQVVYCSSCGAACPADAALFCRKCGAKLKQ